MSNWYDRSYMSKKIDSRSIKPYSEPYSEYDPNPKNLNQWNDMTQKKEPDAIVRHCLSPSFAFFIVCMGIYFLAKLIFLIYNDGNVINIVLNG